MIKQHSVRALSSLIIPTVLMCLILKVAASGADLEMKPGIARFKADRAIISMPHGTRGVVFDTSACLDCRQRLPAFRFLGNLKIDSIIYDDGTRTLDSAAQLTNIRIKSTELLISLDEVKAVRLERRFPSYTPGDTLYWDSLLKEWKILPDLTYHYKFTFDESTDLDSVIKSLETVQGISNRGGYVIPTYNSLSNSTLSADTCDCLPDSLICRLNYNDAFLQSAPTVFKGYLDERAPDGSGGSGFQCSWGYFSAGKRGYGINVAVLDQTVDTSHEDLNGSQIVVHDTTFDSTLDHGTKTAGAIAAVLNNATGIAGVSPDVTIHSYSVQDVLFDSFFQHGIDIVTNAQNMGPDSAAFDAITLMKSFQRIFVTSSGNISLGDPAQDEYPAYWDSITIGVGSVDRSGVVAVHSNYACDTCPNFVDVLAPWLYYSTTQVAPTGYGLFTGTSSSAPLVAATIALARGKNINLSWHQIDSLLMQSSNDSGLIAADEKKYGYGRLDAFKMLELVFNADDQVLSISSDSIPFLIITPDSLIPSFEDFADRRIAEGTFTEIRSMESILSAGSGYAGDDASKVRQCIQDYYENHSLEYVLLGGDFELVPGRYVYSNLNGDGDVFLSDYYYSCLDGDWNADGDTLYGTVNDAVDLIADVSVGRIPVNSSTEVTNYFAKLVNYEEPSSLDWTTEAFVIGSEMYVVDDGERFSEYIARSIPAGFTTTKMYDNGSGDVSATKANYFAEMNEGKGLVFYHGLAANHTHFHIVRESTPFVVITNEDIDTLANASMPSVVISSTCWNSRFDSTAIGESFISSATGGAAAFVSASHNDYSLSTRHMRRQFANNIFDSLSHGIGYLLNSARSAYASEAELEGGLRHSLLGFTLFGDPQLRVWTETPSYSLHAHKDSIVVGHTVVDTITDSATGNPIANAKVCLLMEPKMYEVGYTDANGVISFWPNFEQTGKGLLTATKHNYVVSQDSIDVNQCSVLGDASNDCGFNIADVTYLTTWIFSGGPAPAIPNNADMDRSCAVNIGDATYGIARVFNGGPAPKLGCVDTLTGHPVKLAHGNTLIDDPSDFPLTNSIEVWKDTAPSDGSSAFSIDGPRDLTGLSLIVSIADSSKFNVENATDVPLHWSKTSNYATIGLLDPEGQRRIGSGQRVLLRISGDFTIEQVLATEILPDGTVAKYRLGIRELVASIGSAGGTISFDQNYPNPFNPETNFSFSLPQRAHVKIQIFNVLGQEVTTLVNQEYGVGHHVIRWNSENDAGAKVASGVYFAKFVSGDFIQRRKMVILK